MHAKAFRLPTAALVIAGISIALLASASSASAATMSPASADFGRVLVGKTSAPVRFTVTKDSERRYPLAQGEPLFQNDDGGFVTGYTCLCFEELKSPQGDCLSIPNTAVSLGIYIQLLTATTPSCTITVTFHPEHPGPSTGSSSRTRTPGLSH